MFREIPCDSVAKERRSEYEEKMGRAGGEGCSSRAHGIPHGNQHDLVLRAWTVLRR